ncbi:MAG TPA: hypothetical protein GXZ63_02380 [Mollicutes bacterium]|jgi:hypothetical protein|nr:hypothetical protein [Mollicutes bacterium]
MIGDKIITCGIPFSMGIVKKDAETLHDLDVDELYSTGDKVYLKITDIPDFFKSTNANKGILKQMLFTDYQPNIDSLQIKKVDNNLRIIGDNVLINAVSEQKQYLNKLLEVDIKNRDLNYLNQIEGYIVSQNQNTTNELLENLKKPTKYLN